MISDEFSLFYDWSRYSKEFKQRIQSPVFGGYFPEDLKLNEKYRIVLGEFNHTASHRIRLYGLIDENSGVIVDLCYQVFGCSFLIGILEIICQCLINKTYLQAQRWSRSSIEKELQERLKYPVFNSAEIKYIQSAIGVIERLSDSCKDIIIKETTLIEPALSKETASNEDSFWEFLSIEERLEKIESILSTEIRPYIELDAGGIKILNLTEDHRLTIAYQGACTHCYASTGSTLEAIQHILKNRVYSKLEVVPDVSFLNYSYDL